MWTLERIESLRQWWAEGLSCSQIAKAFACGFSRSAIIGKVHRLRLSSRKTVPMQRERKPRQQGAVKRMRLDPHNGNRPKIVEEVYIEPIIKYEPPVEQRCSLMELNGHTCRFPYGEPGAEGFYFCGGAALEGGPYCVHHARIAYAPRVRRDHRYQFKAQF